MSIGDRYLSFELEVLCKDLESETAEMLKQDFKNLLSSQQRDIPKIKGLFQQAICLACCENPEELYKGVCRLIDNPLDESLEQEHEEMKSMRLEFLKMMKQIMIQEEQAKTDEQTLIELQELLEKEMEQNVEKGNDIDKKGRRNKQIDVAEKHYIIPLRDLMLTIDGLNREIKQRSTRK